MSHHKLLRIVIVTSVLLTLGAPFFGSSTFGADGAKLWPVGHGAEIFWQLRVPRVLLGFFAGAALALSGLAFQALFRNPLATPYTLGVAAGAAFGAAVYLRFDFDLQVPGFSAVTLFAFIGALLSVGLVYLIATARREFSSNTMLLAGVAMSFFFSSLMMFLQYLSDFTESFRLMRWLMGGLETVGYETFLQMLPFVAIGILIVLIHRRELDLISLGEDFAAGRGVNLRRTNVVLFFSVSLMVAGVVAATGPIGFVGIIVPHCCRLLVGFEHRTLALTCLFFGGAFLVTCDTAARLLIPPAEIPVGVITALLGGPFFLWLLLTNDPD